MTMIYMDICMTRFAASAFGIAPSKGPRSGYESLFCLGDALKKNGVSLALDAAGIIAGALPGGATAAGLGKIAFTAAVGSVSTAYATVHSPNVPVGAANFLIQGSGTFATTVSTFARAVDGPGALPGVLKAIPGFGTAVSIFTTGSDLIQTGIDQSACVDSGKYD